ncbi:MAG: penicillin-binding protein activator LpoB [Prolixibacteraceae bacterium]|nr:penicillin-binding protein activator LpoB [Prolixibacteraceae bacterium]
MKYTGIILLGLLFLSACSLLKPKKATETTTFPDQSEIVEAVNAATSQLINEDWLSQFLIINDERPVLMPLLVKNETNATIDSEMILSELEKNLITSGKVRVIKATPQQQKLTPHEILSSGMSIDYVITTSLIKDGSSANTYNLILYFWGNKSKKPEKIIQNQIQYN